MLFTRRSLLRGGLGAAALWALPAGRLAASEGHGGGSIASPNLTPFVDPLPIPAESRPLMRGGVAHHTLVMKAGLAKLHRDLPMAVIQGYNGLFPGPTIRARCGEPLVVRQINRLPAVMEPDPVHGTMAADPAVHLHGAHVAPEHDGHPRDSIPHGRHRDYHYPNSQRAMTLFYHDHSHGHTGRRVYMGLAGLYLIEDPRERLLNLPSGEFDIPLLIQDRVLLADGSPRYALDAEARETGVLGDIILVNGVAMPYLKVKPRKYRLRIVNGSNARIYQLQLSSGRPLVQIASDGGLLPAPVEKAVIPLAPSERVEVVADFAGLPQGAHVVLMNCHGCDGPASHIMRFEVEGPAGETSVVPGCLSEWRDLPVDERQPPRQILLDRQSAPSGATWTINGKVYHMDNPPVATVRLGAVERWRFLNPTNHPHPVHIHLVQFQVLNINGVRQDPASHGWKDTLVAPPGGEITVAARFAGHTGKYLMHCHNLEHEDLGMMADYEIVA